jgi:hypothetical protein
VAAKLLFSALGGGELVCGGRDFVAAQYHHAMLECVRVPAATVAPWFFKTMTGSQRTVACADRAH